MNDELFNLIERLANLLRQETRLEGLSLGLQPIQQEALYYLSTCNRYSDTTLAVTEFLGLTKGTVSQSLKVLENKSLIIRQKDEKDKRITHLKVTNSGQAFLAKTCPPQKFSSAVKNLSTHEQDETKDLLYKLLNNYQEVTGRTAFGVCKNCKFNQNTPEGIRCGLTFETLSLDDVKLICKEYST
ncbi:MarR family winged helix-turn-helix transcriptional regulator [Pseudoalteromonas denitrificans]|uniref:DNA-binding transcriptional regulator, MarR family n=1 Tax=Pseudoalteromonas denitrificans DSM 6059 TaxID=1123010 RepID=A0A1I1TI96_9GAMM|nr:MarR family winged helix-turn-helix transcriptional regulator [Pseudoalteromonas denitrificans]SFD58255.1 DNA-binding transcriptional regulator, MarR family [Pseudoalteromonas denitrificans DSM 6059]